MLCNTQMYFLINLANADNPRNNFCYINTLSLMTSAPVEMLRLIQRVHEDKYLKPGDVSCPLSLPAVVQKSETSML